MWRTTWMNGQSQQPLVEVEPEYEVFRRDTVLFRHRPAPHDSCLWDRGLIVNGRLSRLVRGDRELAEDSPRFFCDRRLLNYIRNHPNLTEAFAGHEISGRSLPTFLLPLSAAISFCGHEGVKMDSRYRESDPYNNSKKGGLRFEIQASWNKHKNGVEYGRHLTMTNKSN